MTTDPESPLVELARVMVRRDDDGELVYSAQANDWLMLLSAAEIATMLAMGAQALDLLAESFDPDVTKTEPAPVLALVPRDKTEGDDDERPDQPA